MKIKMLIPVALILVLTLSLCACSANTNTGTNTTVAPTTAPATTVAAEANTTTAAPTTAPATEAQADTSEDVFTGEDALALVESTHELTSENLYYVFRGIYMIDGYNYYAIDLRKSFETNSTYMSTYFVNLDGSEVQSGYIVDEVGYIGTEKPAVEVTEENAVKIVEAAYDFEENCFLTYKGVEEIDGVTYYAVDLRKSLEANTTYLSTYFVNADGTEIVLGYYEGGTPVLGE
ncbi:MAG: hypothetical protein E7532_02110 [Ruminococcaceae bacterium]|nr:hypothetical protein [Oscillospiraceae bacterium]